MKAFMSDRSGRLVVWEPTKVRAVRQSVDEAQRILAETERATQVTQRDATVIAFGPLEQRITRGRSRVTVGEVLAESLAAFIAMPLEGDSVTIAEAGEYLMGLYGDLTMGEVMATPEGLAAVQAITPEWDEPGAFLYQYRTGLVFAGVL